jgi:hypothetical protein
MSPLRGCTHFNHNSIIITPFGVLGIHARGGFSLHFGTQPQVSNLNTRESPRDSFFSIKTLTKSPAFPPISSRKIQKPQKQPGIAKTKPHETFTMLQIALSKNPNFLQCQTKLLQCKTILMQNNTQLLQCFAKRLQ